MMAERQDDHAEAIPTADLTGLRCPKCEYELTGLKKTQCPECGLNFDSVEMRAIYGWDNRRWRKTAWSMLVVASIPFIFLFTYSLIKNGVIPAVSSRPRGYHHPLVRFIVNVARMIPWYVPSITAGLSLFVMFKALAADAPKSALIAFIASIICGLTVILMMYLIVNFR